MLLTFLGGQKTKQHPNNSIHDRLENGQTQSFPLILEPPSAPPPLAPSQVHQFITPPYTPPTNSVSPCTPSGFSTHTVVPDLHLPKRPETPHSPDSRRTVRSNNAEDYLDTDGTIIISLDPLQTPNTPFLESFPSSSPQSTFAVSDRSPRLKYFNDFEHSTYTHQTLVEEADRPMSRSSVLREFDKEILAFELDAISLHLSSRHPSPTIPLSHDNDESESNDDSTEYEIDSDLEVLSIPRSTTTAASTIGLAISGLFDEGHRSHGTSPSLSPSEYSETDSHKTDNTVSSFVDTRGSSGEDATQHQNQSETAQKDTTNTTSTRKISAKSRNKPLPVPPGAAGGGDASISGDLQATEIFKALKMKKSHSDLKASSLNSDTMNRTKQNADETIHRTIRERKSRAELRESSRHRTRDSDREREREQSRHRYSDRGRDHRDHKNSNQKVSPPSAIRAKSRDNRRDTSRSRTRTRTNYKGHETDQEMDHHWRQFSERQQIVKDKAQQDREIQQHIIEQRKRDMELLELEKQQRACFTSHFKNESAASAEENHEESQHREPQNNRPPLSVITSLSEDDLLTTKMDHENPQLGTLVDGKADALASEIISKDEMQISPSDNTSSNDASSAVSDSFSETFESMGLLPTKGRGSKGFIPPARRSSKFGSMFTHGLSPIKASSSMQALDDDSLVTPLRKSPSVISNEKEANAFLEPNNQMTQIKESPTLVKLYEKIFGLPESYHRAAAKSMNTAPSSNSTLTGAWFLHQVIDSKSNGFGSFLSLSLFIPCEIWALDILVSSFDTRIKFMNDLNRLLRSDNPTRGENVGALLSSYTHAAKNAFSKKLDFVSASSGPFQTTTKVTVHEDSGRKLINILKAKTSSSAPGELKQGITGYFDEIVAVYENLQLLENGFNSGPAFRQFITRVLCQHILNDLIKMLDVHLNQVTL